MIIMAHFDQKIVSLYTIFLTRRITGMDWGRQKDKRVRLKRIDTHFAGRLFPAGE